jgi:hypothetical protein
MIELAMLGAIKKGFDLDARVSQVCARVFGVPQ